MKARLIALILSWTAFCCCGQGTVYLATRWILSDPPYYTQVFSPEPDNIQKTGNTALNLPAGTQVYSGTPLTGSGWTAQLFAIPGSTIPGGPYTSYGVPVTDPFVAAFPTTTFRTGSAAGSVVVTQVVLPNVAVDAASAVLQLRVFPTVLGSWAATVATWNQGNFVEGIGASPPFIVNNIGGNANVPPQLTGASFSLLSNPEPSSLALFGIGIGCFLAARRRKPRPDV